LKKYIVYGSSILFSRGLEYLVLFIAPLYLSKATYGEFEFYKKIIELGTAVLTFGLPTLVLTYPKSPDSKKYFSFYAWIFITVLTLIVLPFLIVLNYVIILLPIYFHSIFFNNGIIPPFLLTFKGSIYASFYKLLVSALFYITVLMLLFFSASPELSFVHVCYVLLPIMLISSIRWIYKYEILCLKLKKYVSLFKKLILGSLTIVISNFLNMMFLYTDIMIIKILSNQPNTQIADYSFSLNISNALLLIPLTIVQTDIENLKTNYKHGVVISKKIRTLVLVFSVLLVLVFVTLTNAVFLDYKSTFTIFCVILIAKIFQSLSVLHGAHIIIHKLFKENMLINGLALMVNIVLSYFLYFELGLIGIALASMSILIIRYGMLSVLSGKLNRRLEK
jgi:O-antigen/teichoic acid export membrane protein